LILDNKIKERGVLIPSSPIIVETVLDELKKMKIYFQEIKEMKVKF